MPIKYEKTHFYVCENCGATLGSHNGTYWNGILLCDECRARAQKIMEHPTDEERGWTGWLCG